MRMRAKKRDSSPPPPQVAGPAPAVELLDSQMRDKTNAYTGNVIYLSTFSKILAPGIRLAREKKIPHRFRLEGWVKLCR